MNKPPFETIVDSTKIHPAFNAIRSSPGAEPARKMIEDIYQDFVDSDGNFLEQIQSTGFDARYFELYLFAYFLRSGYHIDRSHPNPDFLVMRDGITVAVEATTVNPSTSGVLENLGKKIGDLSQDEILQYQQNELPIRFGSPLYSKLNKRYWDLEHCQDIPLVLAIEAFHDEEALVFSDNALAQFVYGLRWTWGWSRKGAIRIETSKVREHRLGKKTIPSNFFNQPNAQHISAILFSNSGTNAKFARMGYQTGYGYESIEIERTGFCTNLEPTAVDPTFFSYNLNEPPLVESWGQGLVVLHNPKCLHPLSRDFFVDAVQGYIEDEDYQTDHHGWHPFMSKTYIYHLGGLKKKMEEAFKRRPRFAVVAIPREDFQSACGFVIADSNPFIDEQGWFSDESNSFLGVITRDKVDYDWGYVILARDEYFQFRAISTEIEYPTRESVLLDLMVKIAELLSQPQRIFP